jgi:AcrR family transcriptional regulator|tara:strand:+ start:958 stop:1647 length:690 start_codon:yes stop_codon:yes gene_type:complete
MSITGRIAPNAAERSMSLETYQQRIKEEKRSAAIDAAMQLFLEQGYDQTSLAQIAKRAGISTATIFKRFSTKAALLEAIVEEFWSVDVECEGTPTIGNPRAALRKIGIAYAKRMRRPEMQAIYRLIISEAPRFPDLGKLLFDKGKGPFLDRLDTYLCAERQVGTLIIADVRAASNQFLAIIAGQVFWPDLIVPGCGGSDEEMVEVVEAASELFFARYAAPVIVPLLPVD